MSAFDVAVIGGGAAGMMCAAMAGQRGRRVVLLEHTSSPGEKIRISGGGRCNFTNLHTQPENFLSKNPHFCRSALAGYTPHDFIGLMRRYGIAFHEKHRGQLFCDDSAAQIIDMLRAECELGRVVWRVGSSIAVVRSQGGAYLLDTSQGQVTAGALVVATGGLSIPKIGASDLGYRLARQFGLRVIEPRPGLVPLVFDHQAWQAFAKLAGISVQAKIGGQGAYGNAAFHEDLLFTHRGLSGPAALQISSYWQQGQSLSIDLAPAIDWAAIIKRKSALRATATSLLSGTLPKRLAEHCVQSATSGAALTQAVADQSDKALRALATGVSEWRVTPIGTEGFRKAEVTVGGVDTNALSSRTMEARAARGLYFIGEVVDVTGWLGGYNFQWAWASAAACARAI